MGYRQNHAQRHSAGIYETIGDGDKKEAGGKGRKASRTVGATMISYKPTKFFRKSTMDWKREILIGHMVRQKNAEADQSSMWEYPFPEVAASIEQIESVEKVLGFSLDSELRQFLLHANGWHSFLQTIDLFSAVDLVQGARFDRANTLLQSLENLQELCGFRREELVPIAVAMEDIDVFVISTPNSANPGKVFWVAGQVIDEFISFDEWFLAMVEYSRRQYRQLIGEE
ncbi:SMI1/KNR4 family protein [Undibacterium sp. Ji83W]|uniref:SMI1/KNR4 family protein n=1 Tax=Undibacterium sp. Ji83W TaxID=3413043 RepID=UPI003BF209FD